MDGGFELLPHTADVMISAWSSTVEGCLEQAAIGLVSCFTDPGAASEERTVDVTCDPAPEPELLVELLEEVIFVVDTYDAVPVRADLRRTGDGGLSGEFGVADRSALPVTGPAPKAVTRHGLHVGRQDSTWHCQVVVDV